MLNKKLYAHVVFGLPLEGHFDYEIPDHCAGKIAAGIRVLVIFSHRKRVGMVVGVTDVPTVEHPHAIIRALDETPVFDPVMMRFARSFADRYCCSWGEALFLFLPAYLRLPRLSLLEHVVPLVGNESLPGAGASLLFAWGVTQRWEALLPRIKAALDADKGVLVLVPEVSFLDDVLPRLAPLVPPDLRTLLRQGADKDEYERWRKVRSGQAKLVVGFLSAVFAPVQDLGLIIVLDEESSFYKSEQSPFYHARDAARLRGALAGLEVVLVSATPSLNLMSETRDGRLAFSEIRAALPPVRCLDLGNFKMKKGTQISMVLATAVEKTLAAGGKVLFYTQAARGVASLLNETVRRFPSAKVAGYDKASKALPGDADIVIGTQSVFRHKGSFRPTLAVLPDIDWELHKDDVRAAHAAFVLVRVLRQMAQSEVIVQTRQSASSLLMLITGNDVVAFYDAELAACREAGLPPYGAMAAVVVRSADPLLADTEAQRFYESMIAINAGGVLLMEPQPDRTALLRGKFRRRIMVQAADAGVMTEVIRRAVRAFRGKRDTVVTVNIDP